MAKTADECLADLEREIGGKDLAYQAGWLRMQLRLARQNEDFPELTAVKLYTERHPEVLTVMPSLSTLRVVEGSVLDLLVI